MTATIRLSMRQRFELLTAWHCKCPFFVDNLVKLHITSFNSILHCQRPLSLFIAGADCFEPFSWPYVLLLSIDSGYYLYIETLTGLVGNKAVLVSPQFQQAFSKSKLGFLYHMYGSTIGRLSVYLNDGSNRTRLWTLNGLCYSVFNDLAMPNVIPSVDHPFSAV